MKQLFRRQEAFRILVLVAMMGCLTAGVGELIRRISPAFNPFPLVILSLVVCLEGISTDRLARRLPDAALRIRLHLVEWVLILLLLRLTLSLANGLDALAGDLGRWLERPQSLFDAGLLAGTLLLFAAWALGLGMSRSLEALDPEAEAPPPQDSGAYYAWLTRPQTDQPSQGWQRLVTLFLSGGAGLVFCSGFAHVDIQAALKLAHPATPGILANALLYFALGFTLLGQGHYARLRNRWQRQGVEVAPTLTRRWLTGGIVFVAGLALLVLLLPVRPSLAVFVAAFEVLAVALQWLVALALGVFGLFAYLLSLLSRLFGGAAEGEPEGPPQHLPPPPPEAAPRGVPWWEAIQGLLLWIVIAAVLGYAVYRFVRDRRQFLRGLLPKGGPLRWLLGLLATAWRWLARTGQQVGGRLRALIAQRRAAPAAVGRRRPIWAPARTTAERVRLFYLLTLQQTAKIGLPRRGAETPYEYAAHLDRSLPETGEDFQALTQAFVEARYAQRDFAPADVGWLRSLYQRLRRALRQVNPGSSHPPPR